MKPAIRFGTLGVCLLLPVLLTLVWVRSAASRLAAHQAKPAALRAQKAPLAAPSDKEYCSPALRRTLRRVLQSCGLIGGGRGCQPLQAKAVATLSGGDFNSLFIPMKKRGAIIEFARGKHGLDDADKRVIDQVFADRRGASYFFVVGRASPDGPLRFNRKLSRKRAEAVMAHLRLRFADPELEQQVGLLWLGAEFAQLKKAFCTWRRSAGGRCTGTALNRSAFIAWIDCRL